MANALSARTTTAGAGSQHEAEAGWPAKLAFATTAACALVAVCGSGGTAGLNAEQIARRMNLRHVTAYTAATDLNHLLGRKGGYTSKINCPTAVSRSSLHQPKRKSGRPSFWHSQVRPSAMGYDYIVATCLLRIFDSQTPTQAHALEAEFSKITK